MKPERLLIIGVVAAAAVTGLLSARRIGTEAVAGDSMRPTLVPGDWLVVRRGGRVRAGDIVVARHPRRTDLRVIKRATWWDGNGWWLEGDNPAASHDSWVFGAVPSALIEGRAVARYWPSPTVLARRRAR